MSKKTLNLSTTPDKVFSVFHGNLNSVCKHIVIKLSLLRANIAASQCDILCLSETFLDSGILFDDVNLDIPGYNLANETIQPMLNMTVFLFIFENFFP